MLKLTDLLFWLVIRAKMMIRSIWNYIRKPSIKDMDIHILEQLMLKRNYVLKYNPLIHEPLTFFLSWLENRCYRIMIIECIQHLHNNIEPILQKVKDIGDLNHQDEYGQTWLHTAIKYKNYKAMQILLDLKINPNRCWYGKTPLIQAVLDNDLIATEILLKSGINPDSYGIWFDSPLVEIASDDNYIDMAKLLIKYQAKINGHHLSRPVLEAKENNQSKMQDLLMEHGCRTDFTGEPTFMCYLVPSN